MRNKKHINEHITNKCIDCKYYDSLTNAHYCLKRPRSIWRLKEEEVDKDIFCYNYIEKESG